MGDAGDELVGAVGVGAAGAHPSPLAESALMTLKFDLALGALVGGGVMGMSEGPVPPAGPVHSAACASVGACACAAGDGS